MFPQGVSLIIDDEAWGSNRGTPPVVQTHRVGTSYVHNYKHKWDKESPTEKRPTDTILGLQNLVTI